MKNKRLKRGFSYIAFAALMTLIIINLNNDNLWSFVGTVFSVFTPFIYGFLIAYILKFPFNFFEKKTFAKIGTKRPKLAVIRHPLAILTTYAAAVAVIVILMLIIVPQMVDSFEKLSTSIPEYVKSFEKALSDSVDWVNSKFGLGVNIDENTYGTLNKIAKYISGGSLTDLLKDFATNLFPFALSTVKNFYTGAYNWIIGIVASVYFLSSKDKLCKQMRKLTNAYLPKKWANKAFEVTELSNKVCGNFIIGRVVDALIIGVLCYLVLVIFRFDYAVLIAVVVGVTNIIPFFGPFLGAIPSAFLLLMVDPKESFWFIIIIIIIQQIDGNIIGPKVIGDRIGISGFWVLFSIIIGGGLFGIAGMILGVPAFVIVYNLLSKNVNKRLKTKSNTPEKEKIGKTTDETILK
ncbi:MAG: AI-2E family transporter [Ruminococcus sp.]|nr:AI-2E family transporter [Ruminococcus sp.]